MKMAIITIYDLLNYGNRLQNYATVTYLSKYNISADTLILHYYTFKYIVKCVLKKILKKPLYINWSAKQETEEFFCALSECEKRKYIKFKEFSYKYLNVKHQSYLRPFNHKFKKEYDYYIAGSDQIWNPNIDQAMEWEFLDFAPKGKRISWAASFGVSSIDKKTEVISSGLVGMDYISVREKNGEQIVGELSGREAITLIDPTLMLDADEWDKISKVPEKMNTEEKYIFINFLGEMPVAAQKHVNEISEKYGLKIINIMDENSAFFESGPCEFIYLISHAELIFTDSFHTCIFSFLYSRPFWVYPREGSQNSMLSRINCLLEIFGLERKLIKNELRDDIFEHDYKSSFDILSREREKVNTFLSTVLCTNLM